MPAVARAVAAGLAAIQPAHAAYFRANAAAFDRSLRPWYQAIAKFKAAYPSTPVATTEPVGDYMLQAAGTRNLTPFAFQADIMNGVDPAPQYVSLQTSLFNQRKVKVFLYNQQVTDSLTATFLSAAHRDGIPVVGVYETMPTGYTYQSWMLAEVQRPAEGRGQQGLHAEADGMTGRERQRRLGRTAPGRGDQRLAVRPRGTARCRVQPATAASSPG